VKRTGWRGGLAYLRPYGIQGTRIEMVKKRVIRKRKFHKTDTR